MKRVTDINPNTKQYWNGRYAGEENREAYTEVTAGQSGDSKRFTKVLEYVNPSDRFLDIGCGIGLLTKLVKDTYPEAEVWGTDISDDAIAENTAKHKDITYLHQYIGAEDKLPADYFDVVFCGETIEHLEAPEEAFVDAKRVLKPGGTLIITTPFENRIASDEHIWSFNYDDIEKLYQENGFDRPMFVYLPNMEHLYIVFAVAKKL